jgi:ferredoxin-NADP reductase/pSer/pThr/pTyr-binding forkhead associated (FHA) protein
MMPDSEYDKNRWPTQLFNQRPITKKTVAEEETKAKRNSITHASGPFWVNQLFEGKESNKSSSQKKLQIIKNNIVIHELDLEKVAEETILGRHPAADIQLESARISMFHIGILRKEEGYFVQDLGSEAGSFLNGERLLAKEATPLNHNDQIELPDFSLRCILFDEIAVIPATAVTKTVFAQESEPEPQTTREFKQELPSKKILKPVTKPTDITIHEIEEPKYCPLMSHLIDRQHQIAVWSKGTTNLRVADIVDETYDTKTFRLVSSDSPILFSYQPGQFITILLEINGQEVQRSYSMSSSPSRPHTLDLTVKRVPDGLVSNWLCDNLKLGSTLKVKGPSGKFTCFHYPSNKIMFIAAGSGITPVMSMARWIADTAADVEVKFIASFKTPSEIIFRKELELLSARHSSFRMALTVTSSWRSTEFWTGFTGRINPQMVQIVAPDFKERHIFMCGPDAFMDEMKEMLREMDFPMANLHSESFTAGRVAKGVDTHPKDKKGKYRVKFVKSGVTVKTDGKKSILQLAEANGIELDYSCRAGYCGDCKAKVKGNVRVLDNAEVDEADKAEGFVYTCCSFPESDIKVKA